MRQAILAAMLLAVPVAGWAQQPPPLPPNVQALQQTVLKLTGEALDWQTQAITLQAQLADAKAQDEQHKAAAEISTKAAQAQVADLQKQLADAKAKETPK